jgi:hypothetical protein
VALRPDQTKCGISRIKKWQSAEVKGGNQAN